MKEILVVNACINREVSRTNRLSSELVKVLQKRYHYENVKELVLEDENLQPLNSQTLKKRLDLVKKSDFSDKMFQYAISLFVQTALL